MQMRPLTGKVAIVTGASQGIGAGSAKGLGAAVVVNFSSSTAGADRMVAAITSTGGTAIAVEGDGSRAAEVQRLFAETRQAFGALDVLVNNAGGFAFAPIEAVTAHEFHREDTVNVLGSMRTMQEVLQHCGPQGGSVITISAIAPHTGDGPLCGYAGRSVYDRRGCGDSRGRGLDHGVGHFRPLSITRQRHLLVYHYIAMSHEGLWQVF
jgi:NAD(P)-dependent dehydrogenase (short-subunit alcohol dehydrogenase family)